MNALTFFAMLCGVANPLDGIEQKNFKKRNDLKFHDALNTSMMLSHTERESIEPEKYKALASCVIRKARVVVPKERSSPNSMQFGFLDTPISSNIFMSTPSSP